MSSLRGLAVLALATLVATTVTVSPAEARTADPVRYAWIKSCAKGDRTVPCGKWTLTLRSGRTVKLDDARVNPRRPNGTVDREAGTTFAVSGDGRVVNYLKGDILVVRDVASGKVTPLPGRAATLPRGLDQASLDTVLSEDGSAVVVDYLDDSEHLPSLLVDLRSGKIATLPSKINMLGFSPDGRHLLVSRYTDDSTTEFAVFDGGGRVTASRVVPQIVANNSPVALANDGTTTAFVVTGALTKKARLHTYSLASDRVSAAVPLGISVNDGAQRLSWDSAGTLTLWTGFTEGHGGQVTSAAKRTVNARTGAVRVVDSFPIRNAPWSWWLPGE
ncbi:hypothetical protein [Streptosporangium saharense]|uniref:WD40 repeat domain-containing protein n=1 Tax=Streptosporangium saharense TaxID=1706840 RepID=A0A7W7VK91_9ACTN|nr:hypothetical protein [Streptosporangium saharense]MBB4913318.1 hypothetical protein [Streptosporangium saharense]